MNAAKAVQAATLTLTMLSILAMVITAFLFLDEKHADQKKVLATEISLRKEILDTDIKKNAEARVYYKDIAKTRSLEPAEESRVEYLEEQLEQKYDRQRMLEQKQMELK